MPTPASPAQKDPGPGGYAWYVLSLFLVTNVLNHIDRQLPFILMEAIRSDLRLSDAQMGLLGGVMFTLVYSIAGIGMGRLADRWPRKIMLGTAVAGWGLATAAGGLASSFAQLAASRAGLAAGEAAANPTATSMIADYFPPRRRRFALSVFLIGSTVGVMLGLVIGGQLVDRMSWRRVMLLFAVPALIVAALILLTVKEPERGRADADAPSQAAPRLREAIRRLIGMSAFRHVALAACLFTFAATPIFSFAPAFVIRNFGLTAGEAGLAIGLIMGGSGMAGTLLGGLITDKLGVRDPRWNVWVPAVALLLATPLFLGAWWAPSAGAALTLLAVPAFLTCMYLGPTFAVVQELAGLRMRGLAISLLTFSMYAVGGSLGPIVAGLLSDAFTPAYGARGLGMALSAVTPVLLWSSVHFWLASRSLPDDLAGLGTMATAPLESDVGERGRPA